MTFVSKAFADSTVRMAFDKSVIWADNTAAPKQAQANVKAKAKAKLRPAGPTRVQPPVGADRGAGHVVPGATRQSRSAPASFAAMPWSPMRSSAPGT